MKLTKGKLFEISVRKEKCIKCEDANCVKCDNLVYGIDLSQTKDNTAVVEVRYHEGKMCKVIKRGVQNETKERQII